MGRATRLTATAAIVAGATPLRAADAQATTERAPQQRPSTLAAAVDAVLERAVDDQRIVGSVILIVRDGHVVYHRAAGYADREARTPMKEDAVFRLASLTKPIVSMAALALVDQGVLTLDDPVTRWLPWFRPRAVDGSEPRITIRQLMTHTAGFSYRFAQPTDGAYARAGISDGLDSGEITLEENLRRLASVPLSHVPGSAWEYSVAHDVLGAVLERAGGASLPDLVRRLVTSPLGMSDTDFLAHDTTRLATPYADGIPAPVRMSDQQTVVFAPWRATFLFSPGRALSPSASPSGGAGMVGTAADFARLLEAMRTGGGGVLRPETAAAMTQNQIGALRSNPGWGFGLGMAVLLDPRAAGSPQTPGTIMWGGVYGNGWFVDPVNRLTVVELTNTAVEGMLGAGTFPTQLTQAIYSAIDK